MYMTLYICKHTEVTGDQPGVGPVTDGRVRQLIYGTSSMKSNRLSLSVSVRAIGTVQATFRCFPVIRVTQPTYSPVLLTYTFGSRRPSPNLFQCDTKTN